MAFESLTDKFSKIIKKIKGESKLTENNMSEILKEIKFALLDADVNYKVVKEFIENIKEKCIGMNVYDEYKPQEMVVKIVKDELSLLLGSGKTDITFQKNRTTFILLCGLQGSGKTTTASKLAYLFKNKLNKKVLLVACDTYRLAAIEQLEELAKKINVDIYLDKNEKDPLKILEKGKEKAIKGLYDCLICDTAGRLSIDDKLMEELVKMDELVHFDEKLIVVDSLSGQEALNVTNEFNAKLNLTGVIMSKLDSDSRGGAALSIASYTKLGIKFQGTGEKVTDLDIFYPERMAERILGMGDILTFVEKIEENIDLKEQEKATKKMYEGKFTLDDMLNQLKQIKKLGSMKSLLKFIPGMPKITDEQEEQVDKEMKLVEVIIQSMTKEERAHPEILKNSRKVRIAKGSGKTNQDINRVLKKYEQMNEMMKQFKNNKNKLPPNFRF